MLLIYLSRFTTLLFVLAISTGCSQKFNDVNHTVNLAIFGDNDAVVNYDDIDRLPYASIYARIDNGPQAFMVLALAETTAISPRTATFSPSALQLKWISSDKGMLVTENGRVVKTLNLPQGNLVASISHLIDPIKLGLHLSDTPTTWTRRIDWQPGYHFGYELHSEFHYQQTAFIMINDQPIKTMYFTEHVSVPSLNVDYTNDFWIHPETGKVLKSRQKIAPNQPYIDITLLKPFS